MAGLCARVPVAGVRRARAARLAGEFDLPDAGCWVVVRDAQAETLDQFWVDTVWSCADADSLARWPDLLVERIGKSLAEAATLEELARRWVRDTEDAGAFEAWIARLEGFRMHRRARLSCLAVAADPAFGAPLREAALLRAFTTRAADGRGFTPAEREAFVVEGEALLAALASHARAPGAAGALLQIGYLDGFDVPSRCAAGFARLERLSPTDAMRRHVAAMAAERDRWLANVRRAASQPSPGRAYFAMLLGDAEETARAYADDPRPERQAWVRDARARIAKRR